MILWTGNIQRYFCLMYNIKVDSSRARQRIASLIGKADSLPWRQAGEVVKASVKSNFILGGSPTKWQPRKVDVPWPILRKTNTLFNSIYNEPIPNGAAIGTRDPKQAVHNFGYPPRNIPQRKYLFVKPEDILIIRELLRKHLTGARV